LTKTDIHYCKLAANQQFQDQLPREYVTVDFFLTVTLHCPGSFTIYLHSILCHTSATAATGSEFGRIEAPSPRWLPALHRVCTFLRAPVGRLSHVCMQFTLRAARYSQSLSSTYEPYRIRCIKLSCMSIDNDTDVPPTSPAHTPTVLRQPSPSLPSHSPIPHSGTHLQATRVRPWESHWNPHCLIYTSPSASDVPDT
jgi:hypothetical protein